jgi:hypothetical protein
MGGMMTKKRTATFICYYCGNLKQPEESSDEHIVPVSIGGTRNATLTDEVCKCCNKYMGEHVDNVFARDWVIGFARLLAGIHSKGKEPVHYMGLLHWDRPERVTVLTTRMGVTIAVVENTPDNEKRLLIATNAEDPNVFAHTREIIKERFPGIKVANDASNIGKPYEEELIRSWTAVGNQLQIENDLNIVSWDREIVKIALGLTCKTMGDCFTTSDDAQLLRRFLFHDDPEERAKIEIHGSIGIGSEDLTPKITSMWHPGGEQHLFALLGISEGLVFIANLFGNYENTVQVSSSIAYNSMLPGSTLPGVAWLIDGHAKTTEGPKPIREFLVQSIKRS